MQKRKLYLRREISLLLLYVFVINIVFLPNDTFQLKKLSFLLLIMINIDALFDFKNKLNSLMFCYAVLLPSYIILKSSIITGDFIGNATSAFTGYMLLLYFVIKKYDFDFETILMRVLAALALFMVSMGLLDFLGVLPTMSNPILMWFYSTDNAMIGRGARHAFGIIYFMKASPLLLLCLPYFIKEDKPIWEGIVLVALSISGTRANVLMGAIVFLACHIYRERDYRKKALLLILMIVAIYIAVVGTNISEIVLNAFTMKENNDLSRRQTLESILSVWRADPLSFFIGSGYSSEFYSYGLDTMVNTVELSYWNLLRRVGIFVFFIIMYMYFYPVLKTYKCEAFANIGYIAYLITAYTNPLLYTSTGITALVYMYYLLMRHQTFQELQKIV